MTILPNLDPVFHQPVRTRLAALLNADPRSFSQLKALLEITDGNLDAHLRKLGGAGYLQSQMIIKGRPHTIYRLSSSGKKAFATYLTALKVVTDAATSVR